MPLSVTKASQKDLQPHPWLPLHPHPHFAGSALARAFALKPVLSLRDFSWNGSPSLPRFPKFAPEWNSAFFSSLLFFSSVRCLEIALDRTISVTVLSSQTLASVLPVMISGMVSSGGFLPVSQDVNHLLLNVPQLLASEGPKAKATGFRLPSPSILPARYPQPSQGCPRKHCCCFSPVCSLPDK